MLLRKAAEEERAPESSGELLQWVGVWIRRSSRRQLLLDPVILWKSRQHLSTHYTLGRKGRKGRERMTKQKLAVSSFQHSAYVYFCSGPTPLGLQTSIWLPLQTSRAPITCILLTLKKNQSVLQVERKTLKVSSRAQLQHNLKYVIQRVSIIKYEWKHLYLKHCMYMNATLMPIQAWNVSISTEYGFRIWEAQGTCKMALV